MKKFLCALGAVMALGCTTALAKDYVTMVSPAGEEADIPKATVGSCLSAGYSVSGKEDDFVWSTRGESDQYIVSYGSVIGKATGANYTYDCGITNNKILYFIDGSHLCSMDLSTGAMTPLTAVYFENPYNARLLTVYNDKVYFTDQVLYEDWDWDYSTYEYTTGGIYSYNLATGEYAREYFDFRVGEFWEIQANTGVQIAYDNLIISYDGFNNYLMCYDLATGQGSVLSYSYAGSHSDIYRGGFFYLEGWAPYVAKVRYHDLTTGINYDMCDVDCYDQGEYGGYFPCEITNQYVAYYNESAYLVHYFNEADGRWVAPGEEWGKYVSDEAGNLYMLTMINDAVCNLYRINGGAKEYLCQLNAGDPIAVSNGKAYYVYY